MNYLFTLQQFTTLETTVDLDELKKQIILNIACQFVGAGSSEDGFNFDFVDVLSESEEAELNSIISLHVGKPVLSEIQAAREAAKERVDQEAERVRSGLLSFGTAMIYVYSLKLFEAQAFVLLEAPDLTLFPLLAKEATARSIAPLAVAEAILAAFAVFKEKISEIERIRIVYKLLIDASEDVDHVQFLPSKASALLDNL